MFILRRRLLLSAALILCLVGGAFAQSANEKVYVTKTGAKYHRATCRSLAKSKIEVSLADAAARYGACKNCKPPILTTTAAPAAVTSSPRQTPAARAVVSGQCQATTKKGSQCSRRAQHGRSYCWQH
jgi:hypothetical protein